MAAPDIAAAKRAGLTVDFDRLAAEGDGWLTAEDRYALKTHGVCAQVQPGVFMVRIRIPGGRLTPSQGRGLADLADRFGQGWVHLSTRQNIELHWVAARDVPTVLAEVEALDMSNRSACGHTMRNVMSCPDAGVGLDEPFDCYPDAVLVSDTILARSAELNCVLPSRINIAFGGCPTCRDHARINDAGFVSTISDGVAGYRLWAAGSLGTSPFLAIPLIDFVPRADVVAAAFALVEVFVAHGDLDNPKKGRMKFVVEAMGEQAFRDAFMTMFDRARTRTAALGGDGGLLTAAEIGDILRHVPPGGWGNGVRPQRTPGLAMVTVNVPLGDLTGVELRCLADLSAYGDEVLRVTRNQNVLFRDVPVRAVAALRTRLADLRLAAAGSDHAVDVRACTGSAVCALAITAAPSTGHQLVTNGALARNASLRVHVSGCPNSCAQHQASDVGLSGAKVRINGQTVLGYHVWVGADLAAGRLGTQVGRVAEGDVPAVVDALIGVWEVLRHPDETVATTVERIGAEAFAVQVAGIAEGFEAGVEPAPFSVHVA